MDNFRKLNELRPNIAEKIKIMTKEELWDNYALLLFEKEKLSAEKEDLADYKENNEFFETQLEHIVNLGIKWLKKNKKNKHQIIIKPNKSKLVKIKTETKFI